MICNCKKYFKDLSAMLRNRNKLIVNNKNNFYEKLTILKNMNEYLSTIVRCNCFIGKEYVSLNYYVSSLFKAIEKEENIFLQEKKVNAVLDKAYQILYNISSIIPNE